MWILGPRSAEAASPWVTYPGCPAWCTQGCGGFCQLCGEGEDGALGGEARGLPHLNRGQEEGVSHGH